MAYSWAVIQLSQKGEEKVEDGTLAHTLRRDLGLSDDQEIFIPCLSFRRNQRLINVYLLQGYVFVPAILPDYEIFALERKPYVESVMSVFPDQGMLRGLRVISDMEIQAMKRTLQEKVAANIEPGQWVKVKGGPYRNVQGQVMSVVDNLGVLCVELRSLVFFTTLPLSTLEPLDEGEGDEGDGAYYIAPHKLNPDLVLGEVEQYLLAVDLPQPLSEIAANLFAPEGWSSQDLPVGWNQRNIASYLRDLFQQHKPKSLSYTGDVVSLTTPVDVAIPSEDYVGALVLQVLARLVEFSPYAFVSQELVIHRVLLDCGWSPRNRRAWDEGTVRKWIIDVLHTLQDEGDVVLNTSQDTPFWGITKSVGQVANSLRSVPLVKWVPSIRMGE